MNETPSRTVVVTLDTETAALLMSQGAAFHSDQVKHSFRQHFKPLISIELSGHPGSRWLHLTAQIASGILRLIRSR